MLALASSGRVTKAADISGLCEQLSRKLAYTFTSDVDLRPCQECKNFKGAKTSRGKNSSGKESYVCMRCAIKQRGA
jgi:hypothetical protein